MLCLIRKFDVFLNYLKIVKNWALLRSQTVIFYVLYNNFFYVLLSFVFFYLQKDFHGVHDNTDAFFIFLQKDFDIFQERIDAFCLLLLRKDFNTFHEPLFELFLCLSDGMEQSFLYTWKNIRLIFIARIYVVCFYLSEFSLPVFSTSEFSLSESSLLDSSEEIYISLIIHLGIFFSLTTYLHSSENTRG